MGRVPVDDVVAPVLAELASRGAPYVGVLYAGLVLTADGPRVLEFNARLGDPEAQAVLPRLTTPLAPLLAAAANGRVDQAPPVGVDPRPCVTVVLAAQGHPGAVVRGRPIEGVDAAAAREDVAVFHAGTAHDDAGGSSPAMTPGLAGALSARRPAPPSWAPGRPGPCPSRGPVG